MPKSWDEVASDPAYTSLSPDKQQAVKTQYFDQVVAPSVPKDKLESARTQFNSYSVPSAAPKPESAAMDVAKTAASLPERFGVGILMGLPNIVNQAVAGPQYLGRGIAENVDKAIGIDPQPRGEIWQPYIGSEEALQKLPEPLRPHVPTTAAGEATDLVGNLAAQVALGKPAQTAGVAKTALSKLGAVTKPFLQDESSTGPTGQAIRHPLDTVTKIVGSATKAGVNAMKPVANKLLERKLDPALQSPMAKEGVRLGKKFGTNFSAGELTGNQTVMGLEDALANRTSSSDKFAAANQAKTDAIIGGFKKTLDKIHPQTTSRAGTGEKLSAAYKSTLDKLIAARRGQASVEAEAADLQAGGKPVIEPKNFIATVQKFIKESESPTATPAQQAAGKEAAKMLENLTEKPPKESSIVLTDKSGVPIPKTVVPKTYKRITAQDLQNGLQAYGDGAYSGKGIWKKLDTASDRRFSVEAKEALQADLDAAADASTAARALKKFRDNYRVNSQKISDIEKTTIGKIVGGAEHDSQGNLVVSPEAMADKFSAMEPTELKNTMKFLDKNHPDVAKMVRRYTLEKALVEATEGRGQRGTGTTKPFAKAEFVTKLPSDEKMNALFNDPKAAKDVNDVASAMNRLIDFGASRKGPQTAQRSDTLTTMNWKLGAIYKSLLSDSLADDLLNPQMRKALVANAKAINNPKTATGSSGNEWSDLGSSLGMSFKDFMRTNIK